MRDYRDIFLNVFLEASTRNLDRGNLIKTLDVYRFGTFFGTSEAGRKNYGNKLEDLQNKVGGYSITPSSFHLLNYLGDDIDGNYVYLFSPGFEVGALRIDDGMIGVGGIGEISQELSGFLRRTPLVEIYVGGRFSLPAFKTYLGGEEISRSGDLEGVPYNDDFRREMSEELLAIGRSRRVQIPEGSNLPPLGKQDFVDVFNRNLDEGLDNTAEAYMGMGLLRPNSKG